VLLIAGATQSLDWWPDEFRRRLAAGGRFVICYDQRDTGRSTSFPAGFPPYTEVDLAHDALGVLDALGVHRAHLVGLSTGGLLAQRIAVERPHRVLSLTLLSTSPTWMGQTRIAPVGEAPDWCNRKAAVAHIAETVRARGGAFTADEPHVRRLAERVYDRTRDMAAGQVNHLLAEPGPPVRDRLGEIAVPALVLHGTQDPVVGGEHATALSRAIPGARLVWLDGIGHEAPPDAVWPTVIGEILGLAARGRQPA
jgi:pimeloyl-ACP methyl ester carboxylesterase